MAGLVLTAAWMPMMATASSFTTALALIVVQWVAIALIITPSLAYMAEVTAFAGGVTGGPGGRTEREGPADDPEDLGRVAAAVVAHVLR